MSVTAMDLVAAAKHNITEITVDTAKNKLPNLIVLDVREADEFAAGSLPGAINIPRGVLEFKITAHPEFQDNQDKDILVYCQSGGRSALATDTLKQLGYNHAVSMAGGFKAWIDSGYDIA